MIFSLSINNIVLVEKIQIEIAGGLTALTGETGAGKSILLDAIGLVIGGRGDSSLVRNGTEKAVISAEFEIDNTNHPVWNILNDLDIITEAGEPLILKRSMTADGKSRCWVNGQSINVKDLREIGETLVDVQGQFDGHGLLSPATHMNMLDNYSGLSELKSDLKNAYTHWGEVQSKYNIAMEQFETAKADEEYIIHCLDELEKCDLQENEEPQLQQQKIILKNADKLLQSYNEAYGLLNSEMGAENSATKAQTILERISDIGGENIETALENLENANSELANAIALIGDEAEKIQQSANDLQVIEDRLYMLSDLAKKHRCNIDDLITKRNEFRVKCELLDDSSGGISQIKADLESAKNNYVQIAEKISQIRMAKASELSDKVNSEMPNLALDGADFKAIIETTEVIDFMGASPTGIDKIRFTARTNVGAEFSPIHKSASGGELSRILLAINLALAETNTATTLLFDEVDSGVGGTTAHTIGNRLRELAKTHQVIVITHSPQVAGIAQNHFFVSKSAVDNSTVSEIEILSGDGRINEIARMLSGDTITEESKANAVSLMGG